MRSEFSCTKTIKYDENKIVQEDYELEYSGRTLLLMGRPELERLLEVIYKAMERKEAQDGKE